MFDASFARCYGFSREGAGYELDTAFPIVRKGDETNVVIALDHSGVQHRLQFHQIFPKAVLASTFTPREADDIANLAFIGGKTNHRISVKAPTTYFPAILEKSGPAALDRQCIPTDVALLDVGVYKQFLVARRKAIAARLNAFLES